MRVGNFRWVSDEQRGILLVLSLLGGLAVAPLLGAAVRAGANMIAHDLLTDYVIGCVWAVVLGFGILFWPVSLRDRVALLALWSAKSVVALGLMLFYESSYSSLDAFGYFQASLQPSFDWKTAGLGSGTGNLVGIAWLHDQLIPNSYHALKISFAMVGLIAAYIFYRAAITAGATERLRLLCLIVLTPSILFWSSIVGKDPLILFGVAVYSYGVVRWVRGRGLRWLVLAILGVVMASVFRLWLGPILLLPVVVVSVRAETNATRRAFLLAAGVAALLFAFSLFKEKFLRQSAIDIVDAANVFSQSWAVGGSAQVLSTPFTGFGSIIRFIPLGMFTALLRPLPGEVRNIFGLLAGLENAGLLVLVFLAVSRTKLRDFRDPLVLWATTVVVTWGAVYGFISYQNLGSGVRFRLQILPVFLLLLLNLARRRSSPRVPGRAESAVSRY